MADPDPNDKVTLAGSGVLLHVQRPDGKPVPVQGTNDGAISTSGGGGGGATLAEQEAQTTLLTTLAGTVQSAAPGEFDPGVSVRIVGATQPVAAVPPPGTIGDVVWSPQLGDNPVQDENTVNRLGVVVVDGVKQGFGDRLRPWYVASTPDGSQVQQVAIADKQDTGNSSLASIDGKIPADPATDTQGAAIEAAVTALAGGATLGDITTALGSPLQAGGSVSVSNFPATQPVSGPLTDAELRASPVPVAAASLPLPTGAATSALQGAGLPSALTAGGGVKVGLVDALPAGANALGSVSVSSGSITETNSSTIATNTGRIPAQGQALAAASTPVVLPLSQAAGALALQSQLPAALGAGGGLKVDGSGTALPVSGSVTANIGTSGALALDATLTGGTQVAIAKGPVSPGAAVGSEKPVLVGGTDGTNAQLVNVDSTGAVRLQSGGTPGAAAPSRATQIGGSDGTNLRSLKVDTSGRADVLANMQVASAAVTISNPVPTLSTATELAPAYVRLPQDGFGRTVTVEPTPVIEAGFCYGAPSDAWANYVTLTGTVTTTAVTSSLATASTGANASSIATLYTLARHSYRAGQALRLSMTTLFSAPAVGGFQVVGAGIDDGYAVGYNGTAFGFLRRSGGRPEIRTLTITTASTTNENITVTLDGVAKSVAVTNSGNTVTTAREIAAADYSTTGAGWDAYQLGSTVIFANRRAAPRTGSYSITATTAVGSYAQTIAGVTPTDTWVAQTAWNGDRLNGATGANNASGATLDPTKLQVWQVLIPFLGAGNVILQWQDPTTGQWSTCHTIRYPNSATEPTVKNPSFTLWIESSGAANISSSAASMALFADGRVLPVGARVPVPPVFKTTVGNASELPIVTVRAERVYNGAPNRSGFKPLQLTASAAATGQVMLRFYRNAVLTGSNFGLVNSISPLSYDSSATAATGGFLIGDTVTSPNGGSTPISLSELGYSLSPGDAITITAQQTNGTNGTVCLTVAGYHDSGSGTGL